MVALDASGRKRGIILRMKKLFILSLAGLLSAWMTSAQTFGHSHDLAVLLRGVKNIDAPGLPGPICVFGPQAFAVVAGKGSGNSQVAVVAATRFGRGRVVAFGHDGYLSPGSLAVADTGRLLANAIAWLQPSETKPLVRVSRGSSLADYLQNQGYHTVEGQLDELAPQEALGTHNNEHL